MKIPLGVVAVVVALAPGEGFGAAARYGDALIKNVPHVRQKPDFCGEACAEMVLAKLGKTFDQDRVFDRSGLDPVKGRGCHTAELAQALRRIGFKIGDVSYKVKAADADVDMEAQWRALHADLLDQIPSIVCTHYDEKPNTTEHFRLVVGYDAKKDEVIYHEPAEADGAYRRMARRRFLALWPLQYDRRVWTVIRLRMKPGTIRKVAPTPGFTNADYAQHVMQLERKVPPTGFTIVIQKPFVVIGDEPPEKVRRRARNPVKWAVDKLEALYFKKAPKNILDIWLFKDKASYEKHTRAIFHDEPTTPFGYYAHAHRALIMNIATGGGTLVHEIVHPFMRANFPECPAWFNEGLGSLYEQCRSVRGRIHGETNWRLAGLQEAIRRRTVPSFAELTATTEDEFYRRDRGTNYAQARYLCYYLQEKGLLQRYYHAFCADRKTDPTGYQTLQRILGEEDMAAFQGKWEAFVLELKFP